MRCDWDMAYEKNIKSSLPYHMNISRKGLYRSLVYSGDHDMMVPYVGTVAWIRSLNYSIIDQWRPWFVDNQVIGYTRSYVNNMTFATIKVSDFFLVFHSHVLLSSLHVRIDKRFCNWFNFVGRRAHCRV